MAWRAVWLFWTAFCLGVWLWVVIRSGPKAVETPFVRPEPLPWVPKTAFGLYIMTWSVSVLRSYRRDTADE